MSLSSSFSVPLKLFTLNIKQSVTSYLPLTFIHVFVPRFLLKYLYFRFLFMSHHTIIHQYSSRRTFSYQYFQENFCPRKLEWHPLPSSDGTLIERFLVVLILNILPILRLWVNLFVFSLVNWSTDCTVLLFFTTLSSNIFDSVVI